MSGPEDHHIWCNFFNRPVDGCKLCQHLNEKYPMGEVPEGQMMAKYFPDAKRRTDMAEPMVNGQGEYSLKQVKKITDGWDVLSDPRPLVAERLWREIDILQANLECERLRLAACGTAAMSNTRESAAKQRIGKDHPYWSGSYEAVCTAVDEEMTLRDELEKAKSWNDECATKAEKALDMAEKWRMSAAMVASDGCAFFSQYNEDTGTWEKEHPVLCLNMNDVFAWASADAEAVPFDQIPEVYELWKKEGKGDDHLTVWACKKRNAKPQKPYFDRMKPEFQEQVKDLPRFGDEEVSVGDGKACVFDDGWGPEEEKEKGPAKPVPSRFRRALNSVLDYFSLDIGKI